jgi:ferredoxin-type protein NapG
MSTPTTHPITRRDFTALGLATLGTAALGLWAGSSKTGAKTTGTFQHRPPGAGALMRGGQAVPAKSEADFLARCVRCGQCAAPCPDQDFDGQTRKAIQFHGVEAGAHAGTPYIAPRTAPCLMCVDVPCVKACPTGALDHRLTDINEARMGTACIVDREGCLAIQGLRCEVCFNRCPLRGVAITLEHSVNERTQRHVILEPVVHKEACTGCGICEQVCIREEPVIKVVRHIPVAKDSDRFYELKPTKSA